MAGIDFDEQHVGTDDPSTRAELLLLSPSFLVPRLGLKICDTLAIAERLYELNRQARCIPASATCARRCR